MLTSSSSGDRMRNKERRFFLFLQRKKDQTFRVFLRYLEI